MVKPLNELTTSTDHADFSRPRFHSLDVFRGLTICLMIIVNTPGKGASFYPFLVHAPWFGFSLTDLVFPSFLFAVGNSMSFSFSGRTDSNSIFFRRVFTRSAIIFLSGFLMYWFPFVRQSDNGGWHLIPFDETRIMGVLQRIALAYCFASLLVRFLNAKSLVFFAGFILLAYWGILLAFGNEGAELTMTGNAIVKLDIWLFGEGHIYKKELIPFDPEGLLSTLPSIVNVLAGYWVGKWVQGNKDFAQTWRYLLMVGFFCIALALMWSQVFPVSKKLWTSSFTLLTIGLDVLLLAALVFLFEWKGWLKSAFFFTVLGKNPLFVYLFSELSYVALSTMKVQDGQTVFAWVSIAWFQRLAPGAFGALLTAVAFMLVCWVLAWVLNRYKMYIKI